MILRSTPSTAVALLLVLHGSAAAAALTYNAAPPPRPGPGNIFTVSGHGTFLDSAIPGIAANDSFSFELSYLDLGQLAGNGFNTASIFALSLQTSGLYPQFPPVTVSSPFVLYGNGLFRFYAWSYVDSMGVQHIAAIDTRGVVDSTSGPPDTGPRADFDPATTAIVISPEPTGAAMAGIGLALAMLWGVVHGRRR